jgi:hypothetical protein
VLGTRLIILCTAAHGQRPYRASGLGFQIPLAGYGQWLELLHQIPISTQPLPVSTGSSPSASTLASTWTETQTSRVESWMVNTRFAIPTSTPPQCPSNIRDSHHQITKPGRPGQGIPLPAAETSRSPCSIFVRSLFDAGLAGLHRQPNKQPHPNRTTAQARQGVQQGV